SGPGGWAVKVAQAARQPVRRQSIGANNTKLVEKADEKELDRELRGFDDSKPIAMTIVVEPNSYYTSDAMSLYLDRLAEFTRLQFVVFVGPDRVHIGHVRPVVLRNLLRDSDRSSRFIERLNIGKVAIELSTATIRTESAALEALRAVDEKDVHAV